MKLINLLPGDTRIVEILSAFTILSTSIFFMFDSTPIDMISLDTPRVFWFLILTVLGLLQLISLLKYPDIELLRCACSMLSGVFWLWFFLAHFDTDQSAGKFIYLFLSVGNFYAFFLSHRGLLKC